MCHSEFQCFKSSPWKHWKHRSRPSYGREGEGTSPVKETAGKVILATGELNRRSWQKIGALQFAVDVLTLFTLNKGGRENV